MTAVNWEHISMGITWMLQFVLITYFVYNTWRILLHIGLFVFIVVTLFFSTKVWNVSDNTFANSDVCSESGLQWMKFAVPGAQLFSTLSVN